MELTFYKLKTEADDFILLENGDNLLIEKFLSVESITKTLTYTIETTPAALTKSLNYLVTNEQIITKSLQYYVLANPYSISNGLYSKNPLGYEIDKSGGFRKL